MRDTRAVRGGMLAAALLILTGPAAAQSMEGTPQGRAFDTPVPRGASPGRLGYGADNDAQPGGVPGNAPFNNQLRKHSDPLGANGGK